jgi:transposase InsO family protein
MHVRMVTAIASAVDEVDAGRGVNVSRLCERLTITRKTFYKWADRYRRDGLAGLEQQSRRPNSSPRRISPMIEDAIIEIRKRLQDEGVDCGADAIKGELSCQGTQRPPSEATIWRVLVRRGFIVPEPRKRPKSSIRRFEAPAPNEWWQIDATEWHLADGTKVEILNIIDDHSRVLVDSLAVRSATSQGAWEAFSRGVSRLGLPRRCLSDNGLIFSGKLRGFVVYFETQLRNAGVLPVTSTPYHPQTCGKVERFQQTLKKWLDAPARGKIRTLAELQTALDEFRDYYNHRRRHRGIGRQIPWEQFCAPPKAVPDTTPVPAPQRTRHAKVNNRGAVQLSKLVINVGTAHRGADATVIVDHDEAAVFIDDRLVRHIKIDPTKLYQASGNRPGPKARR